MATGPNMLPTEWQTFEGGTTGGWSGTFGCTIANSTAQAHTGTHSLLETATTTGTLAFWSFYGITATPSSYYTMSGWMYSTVAGRNIQPIIRSLDAGQNILRTDASAGSVPPINQWTNFQYTQPAPVPSGTLSLQLIVQTNSATSGELYYFDDMGLNLTGATPTYIQWKTHSGTGPGLYPSTVRGRVAQAVASIVSGQNPDGTTRGT